MKSEQGATLPMVMVTLTVLLLIMGLAIEVSRALVEREQLKTAAEAGTLAGALQAVPWLKVTVPESRYACTTITGPDGRPVQDCSWEYRDVVLQGDEADVVPNWRSMADCGSGWDCPSAPTINCRGVTYPGDTPTVMRQAFAANTHIAPDVTTTLGQMQTDDQVGTTRIEASGDLKVQLLRLAGVDHIPYAIWSRGQAEPRKLQGWPVGTCW